MKWFSIAVFSLKFSLCGPYLFIHTSMLITPLVIRTTPGLRVFRGFLGFLGVPASLPQPGGGE